MTMPYVVCVKTKKITHTHKMHAPHTQVRHIAHLSSRINETVENIGARRLHTVMERLMEEYSFTAAEMDEGTQLDVTKEYVEEQVGELLEKMDLKKFIL